LKSREDKEIKKMAQRPGNVKYSSQSPQQLAASVAREYSNYRSSITGDRFQDATLEDNYGAENMKLFRAIDANPEMQALVQHYAELQNKTDEMPQMKSWDGIHHEDPAIAARQQLEVLGIMEHSALGEAFAIMAYWRGWDLQGQLDAAKWGASWGETALAGAETAIARHENVEHPRMPGEPGYEHGLIAKGKERPDPKSFEPREKDLPGAKTYSPEEKPEGKESDGSEKPMQAHPEGDDTPTESSEADSGPWPQFDRGVPPHAGEPNYTAPDGSQILVTPDGKPAPLQSENLNYSLPDGSQISIPPDIKSPATPPTDAGVNQSIQPPEPNQSIVSPEMNQSIQPAELNQSIQMPELNQSLVPSYDGYDADSSNSSGYDSGSYDSSSSNVSSYDSGSSDSSSTSGYDASSYDSGSANVSSYDSGSSDAGSYDSGSSDVGGYSDTGSSDASGASEGGYSPG
jgi:hypothetical protein